VDKEQVKREPRQPGLDKYLGRRKPVHLFPTVELSPFLQKVADAKPDALFVFVPAGSGAQFMKTICTIYDGAADNEMQQRANTAGLAIFNDIISREASTRDLPLIDLRVICDERQDYVNAIEPSVHGGAKIAKAITDTIGRMGQH
jgi:hypothetical protein